MMENSFVLLPLVLIVKNFFHTSSRGTISKNVCRWLPTPSVMTEKSFALLPHVVMLENFFHI
jgi:hypothetical protein